MKLALLDGNSLAYRAFYALPADLATPAGQVTNAVFGFTSMLIKLLGDEQPDAIAVAWDVQGPTFRNEAYPEYKAQRESAPDLFRSQLPLIRRRARGDGDRPDRRSRGARPTTSSPRWPSEPRAKVGTSWS